MKFTSGSNNRLKKHEQPLKLVGRGVRGKPSVQLMVLKSVAIPGGYHGKAVDLQLAFGDFAAAI
jgi:hypothetical protein